MSLINYNEYISYQNNLNIPYFGKVVKRDDPKKLGRIKVVIEDFLKAEKEEEIAFLPWCTPKNNIGSLGWSQNIPEIDDIVEITFPYDDPHLPFYENFMFNETNSLASILPDVFGGEHYEDKAGFIDKNGTYLMFNRRDESVEFNHVSGILLTMDKDGSIYLDIPGALDVLAKQVITIISKDEILLNELAILDSARVSDQVKHICVMTGLSVPGVITKGNSRVKQNADVMEIDGLDEFI